MPTFLLATLLSLFIGLGLSGCRLLLVVPEGGRVITQSGSFQCGATQSCPIDVVDTSFNETFVAVPETGYVFEGWRKHGMHLCGSKTGVCALTTHSMQDNSVLLGILNSDQLFYLSPLFSRGHDSNMGLWQGEWINGLSGSKGQLSLELTKIGKNKIKITVALARSAGNSGSYNEFSIVATQRPNGSLIYSDEVTIDGARQHVGFSLTKAGKFSLSGSGTSQAGLESISLDGTLRGGVLFINYFLTLSPSGFSRGTATAYKS